MEKCSISQLTLVQAEVSLVGTSMIVYLNLDLAYKTPQRNSVWLMEVLTKPQAYAICQ